MPGRSLSFVAIAVAITLGVAACGGDDVQSDAQQFCAKATEQQDMIVAPPMTTEAELAATLDFYRLMGELAPLAIATQWNEIVNAMETASTIAPGDPASEQLVAMQAYATERDAYEVAVWLQRNCGITIPIVTIAPQSPVPAITGAPATAVASTTTPP